MTTNERPTVVGVFSTRNQAESAINELYRSGFTEQQVGYAVRDAGGNQQGHIAHDGTHAGTHAGQNAVGGAVSGGVIGGLIGAASSLLIPGFGPAIAGGILAATLGGAAIGAAAGGLIGALTEMGIPEEEASYYQSEFEAGHFIVTVTAPGQQRQALEILRRNGAYDASTQQGYQDRAGNQPYAQVGTTPSPASSYSQPGTVPPASSYSQPGTHNQSATNNPATSYDPNDPNYRNVRRPYNPDTSNNPNSPNAY